MGTEANVCGGLWKSLLPAVSTAPLLEVTASVVGANVRSISAALVLSPGL